MRQLIEKGTRLKVIGRAGVGVDNVDVEAATRRGIVVANAPESTVVSAAEQTIGLIVASRSQHPSGPRGADGRHLGSPRWSGVELDGKTLGVIGFGRIGQQVARRALGLGMRVLAYDPFVSDDRFRELGVERADDARRGSRSGGCRHAPLSAHRRDARPDRPRPSRRCATAPVSSTPRAGSWSTRSAPGGGDPLGQGRGSRARRVLARAVHRAAARADEVVSRRTSRRRRTRHRTGAGVIVAEQVVAALDGEHRVERGQHPRRRRARPRGARPVRPADGEAGRLAVELAGGPPRGSPLRHTVRSQSTTRGCYGGRVERRVPGSGGRAVNYVNAPLIAASAGSRSRSSASLRRSTTPTSSRRRRCARGGSGGRGHDRRARASPLSRRCARASRSTSSSDRTWRSSRTTTFPA